MDLFPFIETTPLIEAHILSALLAIIFGPFVLFRARRDRWHKILGYIWVCSLIALALSGLIIPSNFPLVGHMGPIHALCFYVLWGLWGGMRAIWRRDIAAHQRTMQQIWFFAVAAPGLFTLFPGRLLSDTLFSGETWIALMVLGVGFCALAWLWRTHRPARG